MLTNNDAKNDKELYGYVNVRIVVPCNINNNFKNYI